MRRKILLSAAWFSSVVAFASVETVPITVIRGDGLSAYNAECRTDSRKTRLYGPVLIWRVDDPPEEARDYGFDDSRQNYLVLYPTRSADGHFFGKRSEYAAEDGDVVLYSFSDDQFVTIGRLPPSADYQEQIQFLDCRIKELMTGHRRSTEAKAAQPGATDNPDDAQRLREDH